MGPLIQGNTIIHNTATRIGGGIGTWQRMAPEIIDNIIADNEATEGDGGGIYLRLLPDDTGFTCPGPSAFTRVNPFAAGLFEK